LVTVLRHGGSNVSTFAIVFSESEFSEHSYSRLIA